MLMGILQTNPFRLIDTMATPYTQMNRAELQAEIAALQERAESIAAAFHHEQQVYQAELDAQTLELREIQSLLEASRDEYAALYDFAPVALLTLDHFGLVKTINLTGCAMLGMERARVLDYPLHSFVIPSDVPVLLSHMRECRKGKSSNTEVTIKTRNNRQIPALLITTLAQASHYRSAILDLSDRKRAESAIRESHARLEEKVQQRTMELERANEQLRQEVRHRKKVEDELQEAHRRKDEFLAMLGHELRNPLNPIRNAADVIHLLAGSTRQVEEMCAVISRQTAHMARLVDDLLDVSRITRGKIALHRAPLDLRQMLHEVLADFANEIAAESIHLQCNLSDKPVWVHGDNTRLSQVIGNLLHNAVKFTDAGGSIEVQLVADLANDAVCLKIRDTGTGIEPEMLSKLFEAFSQADRTLVRSRGGLGLGLALAKGLVELHGGNIAVVSPGLGRGTEVTVRLPTCSPPADVNSAFCDQEQKNSGHYRVLIIDDQPDTLQTMQYLLKKMGHEVYTAANGIDGIHMARDKKPHVIFSDIGLPGIDGYAVARSIRQDPVAKAAFLVAVTGYGREEDAYLAREAGFDRHLTKPIALREIQGLLSSMH
jgi:signal transduction histidine kinase